MQSAMVGFLTIRPLEKRGECSFSASNTSSTFTFYMGAMDFSDNLVMLTPFESSSFVFDEKKGTRSFFVSFFAQVLTLLIVEKRCGLCFTSSHVMNSHSKRSCSFGISNRLSSGALCSWLGSNWRGTALHVFVTAGALNLNF